MEEGVQREERYAEILNSHDNAKCKPTRKRTKMSPSFYFCMTPCEKNKNVQKIKRWKPMSERPIGRPKIRWEDDVLEDIKSMNVRNWKNVAQIRDRWKKVVEQARTLNRL